MMHINTVAMLADVLQAQCLVAPAVLSKLAVSGISIDTRTLQPGECYLALKGENLDGHDFAAQAVAAGAVAIIAERLLPEATVPVLVVPDSIAALTKLAQIIRAAFTKPVVAITGSCGKTTVKETCRHIFQQSGHVLCPQKSYNNHIGLPLTLTQLKSDHDFAILELGTNHPGEIAQLVALAKPSVAVVNNVGPAHLQGFKTLLGVAKEKGSIYDGLAADGIAVINLDDDFASLFQEQCQKRRCITFSTRHAADVTARDIHFDENACAQFELHTPKGSCAVQLALPGAHQVANALAAASCALAAGLPIGVIPIGLRQVSAIPGRWQAHRTFQGATVIDDSYNANPKSVLASLQCLQQLPGEHWYALGDMGELGPDAEKMHAEIGRVAKNLGVQRFFTVGELTQHTQQAFGAGAEHFATREALVASLQNTLHDQVTLVVKGSLKSKMGLVIEALKKAAV